MVRSALALSILSVRELLDEPIEQIELVPTGRPAYLRNQSEPVKTWRGHFLKAFGAVVAN